MSLRGGILTKSDDKKGFKKKEVKFEGLVELPQMVCALGRKDYKNKGVWKTEVHDSNSEHGVC